MEVDQLRSSKKWMRHVVQYSTEYLQNQLVYYRLQYFFLMVVKFFRFKLYMEGIIEKNLEQAQRGGIPGTLSLIEAFLNVARLNYGKIEVGSFKKIHFKPFTFFRIHYMENILCGVYSFML